MSLTLPEFIARWQRSTLSERSAAQSHFIDLCDVLGQPRPAAADQSGAFFSFEKGAAKSGGGDGWADVWFKNHFGWEYKGKRKNLAAAYQQLLQYREDLDNPPLLVVCDLDRFEVHTNFTGTAKRAYAFTLADLATPAATATSALPPLEVLRALFTEPERLRPALTSASVTERAAAEFARLAESLRRRGHHPEQAAHFLMRLLFCLFAEDTGLLPNRLFTRLVERTRTRPEQFAHRLRELFDAMAAGGSFGVEDIEHFNGGLFASDDVLDLTAEDLTVLDGAARLDWASVEPAIFGTLFERSLDPDKRATGRALHQPRGHSPDCRAGVAGAAAPPLGGGTLTGRDTDRPARRRPLGLCPPRQSAGVATPADRLRRRDRGGARARPGVWQRQLPLCRAEAVARPGEGSDHLRRHQRHVGLLPGGIAGAVARHRSQHLRA